MTSEKFLLLSPQEQADKLREMHRSADMAHSALWSPSESNSAHMAADVLLAFGRLAMAALLQADPAFPTPAETLQACVLAKHCRAALPVIKAHTETLALSQTTPDQAHRHIDGILAKLELLGLS